MAIIQIENMTTSRIGIPLKDGKHLTLWPKTRNTMAHISEPFDSSLFPETQSNQKMLQEGKIRKVTVS